MKQNSAADSMDPGEEIQALVQTLHETHRRLQELTGGQLDAVHHPDGQSYLLHAAQEQLRQSGEALRLSENALAVGQQIAHLGSWEMDLINSVNFDANPLCWSDEMFRIAGYEPREIEVNNQLFFGLIPEEDRSLLRDALLVAVREHAPYSVVHRLIRPNGEQRFIHQQGKVFLDAEGRSTKLSGTAHDITEQRVSQQQLSLLYACVAKLNDIVLITEADPLDAPGPKVLFVNEAFERITGYKIEEVVGRNPRFLQGEKTDRKVLKEIREALVSKQPIKRQLLNYDKQGNEYWVEVNIVPVFDDLGKCTHFVAIESDVTEEKKIKEQLAWRTAMFEAQVNSSPDGILIVDSNNKKVLQSQKMTDLWEIPPDIAADPDDRVQFNWVAQRVRNSAAFVERSTYLRAHPDEIHRDEVELLSGKIVDRYSAPVRGADGEYFGRIWFFRDITDRKQAEIEAAKQAELIHLASGVAKLGAWAIEFPGPKIIWSDEVRRIHEVDPGFEPDLQTALNFFPPASREKLEAAIASGQPYDLELDFITAKGKKLWARTTCAVEMKNGEVRRFYGILQDLTDRRRNETRFRTLVDSNVQGVLFWNRTGEIKAANDAFLNIVGYTRDDLEAGLINWMEMTPTEYAHLNRQCLAEVDRQGFSTPLRKEYIRKDGSRVPVLVGLAIFEDDPNQGVGFVIDLTERELAERAQRLSEERFSHAFEYAPNGMVIVAPNGEVITANRTICDLLGYTLDEFTRKGLDELTHPDDVLKEHENIRRVLAGEMNVYQIEMRYFHRDGSEIWTQMSSSLVVDSDHRPLYFIKQVQDITAMRHAHQQIEEQAALIDQASDAILSHNLEHQIIFWSKGAERLFGWTADEAKGKHVKDLLKIESVKFAEADRSLRESGHWNGELQKQNKSGTVLTINTRWTLLRDCAGQPRSILTIDTDVTERKKLEQQFLRAQRMESIGTLAGGIAHDLNNILAPIMMSIDVLRSLSDKPEVSEILETIRVSAKRGSDIVRQVLSFARGVEGKRIEVQPKHILEDVENIVKNTFPKSVDVRTSIPRDTWTILGDPTQIHQILLNLCVNARDAMPNGGKLNLTVENFVLDDQYSVMSRDAKPGPYVQISVTDSGSGIPPELLERIFEPFFTTKEVSKGTGLGLSTVMAIVKSHEGIINVYSEVGKGTTFKVYLPALESSPEKRKVQTQRVSLPRGNGETILVVDDEASILTITCQTLLAFGYRVLKAVDGAEAVALYAKHEREVAVVLTDMMMPVLDGSALIHALKRINPAVKVIAASGLNAEGNVNQIEQAGVNYFLTKPYTAGVLLKTLREILNQP